MSKSVEIIDGKLRCGDCKQTLPISQFSINRARKCGYCGVCKACSALRKSTWAKTRTKYIKAYQKIWRAKNAERLSQYDIDRYWSNPEFHKSRVRKKMATSEGRAKRVLWEQQRRARALNITNDLTNDQWQALLEYYNHRCLACGRDDIPLTRDHVIPITKGGALTLSNVQPLCRPCNASKKQKVVDYRRSNPR